jgi:serine/threonine protein kinase
MKGVETSGDRIGRYRLLEKIGEGGMGVVHLAVDGEGRRVAIKVLRPGVAADQTALRRLAREVDTMRRVHSPHVAEIVDADVTAEPPYVVTQFVPGRTLEETVRDHGPLAGQPLQRLATGLAEALAAIHAAGVIHRDLKPGNVMFSGSGEPVVIDFGIAQGTDATRLTATGLVIGTPGYLAPEIIEGEDAGAAADVHSWATTVAYAATGRAPFGSGTFESIFYKIMEGRPDLAGVPEPMLPLIRAAMVRHPAERPTALALSRLAARIDMNPMAATLTDPPTRPLTSVMDSPSMRGRPPAATRPPVPPQSSPKDFKGQLPPVAPQYPPPYAQPAPQPQYRRDEPKKPDEPKPYGAYRMLSLALLVGAFGLAAMMPAVATIVVLAVLVGLRSADRVHRKLEDRRTRRGPRAGDAAAAVVKTPFAAVRSALAMLLVSPLGMVVALVVLIVALVAEPGWTTNRSISAATAAFIFVECMGPGSAPGSGRRSCRAGSRPTSRSVVSRSSHSF